MLNLSDVLPGERVVLRYRLAEAGAGAQFSDALGEVRQVTDESVTVQTRSELMVVPRAMITHAKRVPPPPARRRPRAAQE